MGRRELRTTAILVAAFVATVGAARPAAAQPSAAAYADDFPDPYVLAGSTGYWAYATGSAGRNLQVVSSSDLVHWSPPTDPLPILPSWASVRLTWAPGVIHRNHRYVMYYTVHDAAAGRQCVSLATSSTAEGPFSDTSTGPLICQLQHGGSIDPSPFVDSSGITYLLWKSDDNAIGQATKLWAQQLSSDGLALVGPRSLLLTADQSWQAGLIEGPSLKSSGGTYYLFYSANYWDSAASSIGYATCRSPLGPCTNASVNGPWLASHGRAVGPAGPALFTDRSGVDRIAYHAWLDGVIGYPKGDRAMWIKGISFVNGRPVLS